MSARVLIGCEHSGVVRDAFLRRGVDAWSCDLLPTASPGPHLQCDVREVWGDAWGLVILHPDCTFLSNSGVRWLYTQPGRWEKMQQAALFFRQCLNAPVPRLAVENPVMHGHARKIAGRGPDCSFQPWQHGHGEIKRTCLWLKNLPPLMPSRIVAGREAKVHRAAPSPDRWKIRSRTLEGVAEAMAAQWGALL